MTLLFPLLFASLPSLAQEPLPDLRCMDLPPILLMMEGAHYASPELQDTARISGERFVELLDPTRSMFLADEASSFQETVPGVFFASREGDCSLLEQAAGTVIARAQADATAVDAMLVPGFKVDPSVELIMDSEAAGWPKDEAERQQRLVARVNYQVWKLVDDDVPLDEALEKVKKRYQLTVRRQQERRAKTELPALYAEAWALALDPHSAFFTAEDLADFNISTQLSLEGIGAALLSKDGFTKIDRIVPGGPADRDGRLQEGDLITAVAQGDEDPVDIIDMDLQDVVQLIRGPKDSQVKLSILRKIKGNRTFDLTLTRDKVDLEDQAAKLELRLVERGDHSVTVGVLDLPSFYGGERGGRSASQDVDRLLRQARDQGVAGIVLDVSRDGGGMLNEAVDVAGLFIKRGAVVASRSSEGEIEVLEDENSDVSWAGPVVILTSPGTASAAEILTGTLRDYDRVVVVGMDKQSFGKGTIQQLVPLPGGIGAIKITTGMYFLPAGDSTQNVGVPSDLVVPSFMQGADIGEDEMDGALPAAAIPPFASTTVNGKGDSHWKPIKRGQIAKLREASLARTAQAEVLQQIVAQQAEANAKDDQVRVPLAEIQREIEDAGDDGPTFDEAHDAFVDEGVQVLLDLVDAQSGG